MTHHASSTEAVSRRHTADTLSTVTPERLPTRALRDDEVHGLGFLLNEGLRAFEARISALGGEGKTQ